MVYTRHKTESASVHVRKFRHETRSASVRIRKKSCGSGFADWHVRSPHISVLNSHVNANFILNSKPWLLF